MSGRRVYINAEHCAEYLRGIGVHVSDETAAAWLQRENDDRDERAARRRELKHSCGHFRTYWTRIISDERGDETVRTCQDCQRYLERKPTPRTGPNGGKPLARPA